jgi:hypothetical protein
MKCQLEIFKMSKISKIYLLRDNRTRPPLFLQVVLVDARQDRWVRQGPRHRGS